MIKTNNSEGIGDLQISKEETINTILKEQEICLLKLIEHIKKPFQDKWEYSEWHREAVALELSNTERNGIFIDNKALWHYLIKGAKTPDDKPVDEKFRDWIIYIMHNFLEIQFTRARIEIERRGREEEEI